MDWRALGLLPLALLCLSELGGAQNQTAVAAVDGTGEADRTELRGQKTHIIGSDGSVQVMADANGTATGAKASETSLSGDGNYVSEDVERNVLSSLGLESVGNDTSSRGQVQAHINKVPNAAGSFDWEQWLTALSRGLAEGTGLTSSGGNFGLDYQAITNQAVQKSLQIMGEHAAQGDGDKASRSETAVNARITPDNQEANVTSAGSGLGQLGATGSGTANLTKVEDGDSRDIQAGGIANGSQNGRDAASSVGANGEALVQLGGAETKTEGMANANVVNEEDGIGSLDTSAFAKDGAALSSEGQLAVRTDGDAGAATADGAVITRTFDVDCTKDPAHECCQTPAGAGCSPGPGAEGTVDKFVTVKGTKTSFGSTGRLKTVTGEGTTELGSANDLSANGTMVTTVNGSLLMTQDRDGETMVSADNRGEARADGSQQAGVKITSATGVDSEPRGETELTDALSESTAVGGESWAAGDTNTLVRSGKTTLGGAGAQGGSVNDDGTGSEVVANAAVITERVPGTQVTMNSSSFNVASGDRTDVQASARTDLLNGAGEAVGESTAEAAGSGPSSISMVGTSTSNVNSRRRKRSITLEALRPRPQPRAVCIGRKCFLAAPVEGRQGRGGSQLLTLADLLKAFGLRVARIEDAETEAKERPHFDQMFVYAQSD